MQYPVSSAEDIKIVLGGTKYTREWNQVERNRRVHHALQDIAKRVEWGYIDDDYTDICLGIIWGIDTGRVTAYSVIGWLKSLSLHDLLRFLEEVRGHCKGMMEVVSYLNTICIIQIGYRKDMYPIYRRKKSLEVRKDHVSC